MGGIDKPEQNLPVLTSSKDVFSRTPKLSNNREVSKTIVEDPRKVEIKKAFPQLSQAWINKIFQSYKKYNLQEVKTFFAHAKKYNKEKVPQSLIAVSLIQYAQNNEKALLSTQYDDYVAAMITEHKKAVRMSELFIKNTNPAFEDFKKRKQAKQKVVTTIEDVIARKGYTNETYVLYEYIESASFQQNKEKIITSLDADQKTIFAEYLASDVRLSQIAKVDVSTLQKSDVKNTVLTTSSLQGREKKNTLQNASYIFEKDFAKNNGPKVVLDELPQSVLGNERLSNKQKEKLLLDWQKKLLTLDREHIVTANRSLFSEKYSVADIISALSGKGEDSLLETEAKKGLLRMRDKYQKETLQAAKQKVMQVYFEQVGSVLQAGGDVVNLENKDIAYDPDGSIHMKFSTLNGLRGEIFIDANGVVYVADLYGYQATQETQSDYAIIRKNLQQRLQGGLPSMKIMMERVAQQKDAILADWYTLAVTGSTKPVSIDAYISTMITPSEEHARHILQNNMTRTLLMTQSIDVITKGIQTISTVHKPITQDYFLQYVLGAKTFIDTQAQDTYKPLAILRATLARSSLIDIERRTTTCGMLLSTYTTSTSLTKEGFPFGISESDGKETFWQFLSRFCVNENEFDIRSFEQVSHIIANQKTPYRSIIDCYVDNPGYFPKKSLYGTRFGYESLDTMGEQKKVIAETTSELDDLNVDIALNK